MGPYRGEGSVRGRRDVRDSPIGSALPMAVIAHGLPQSFRIEVSIFARGRDAPRYLAILPGTSGVQNEKCNRNRIRNRIDH